MPVTSMLMGSLSGGSGGSGGIGQGVANAAGGLIGIGTGLFQKKKANRMLGQIGDQPIQSIPEEILRNQKQAELNAQQGLPSQQYNNAMKNIQRSQANAIAGSLDRRSALMALPKIQRQTNDAYGNLDAQDAMTQRQNQNALYSLSNVTGQYKNQAFQNNQLNPWMRKYNYSMGLLGAGNQNFMSGLDKLVGGAGMILGGSGMGNNGGKKGSSGNGYDQFLQDQNRD